MRTLMGLLIVATAILFATEAIADTWPEGQTLIAANHAETGFESQDEFSPDIEKILLIEKAGLTRLFTMRERLTTDAKEARLVGYALFSVTPHLLYSRQIWARQDVLYVDPHFRGATALRFIKWIDERLKLEAVDRVYRTVTTKNDYSRGLKYLGYVEVEQGYVRRIQ
jgi:hypothetical protein